MNPSENIQKKKLDFSNKIRYFVSKQAGKQASRQASRQAGKQASRQAGKQASRQAGKQASRQASKQSRARNSVKSGKALSDSYAGHSPPLRHKESVRRFFPKQHD